MFWKILKMDLRRKKAMNVILFIFMLTAMVLIAGSTNLLYSTMTAVDYFIEKSKVADLITLTAADQEITQAINDWAKNSHMVKEVLAEDAIIVDEEKISASTGKRIRNTRSLIIMPIPKKYNLVFDTEGNSFEVEPSEAAIPVSIQKKLGLSIGDRITIVINDYSQEFTVCNIFKDVVFGAELMGVKRIILNEQDFDNFFQNTKKEERVILWGIKGESMYQNKDLEKEFSINIPTYTVMPDISTVYVLDLVLAAIMIIVSIFLILISFLILRFTIVFTVMEDYKQIGVMKAIGLKNSNIRKIYNVKYLSLSLITGSIGYLLSIPVSEFMKQNISEYILLNKSSWNLIISLISVLTVIGITMLFCNYTTGKIKKISAIEAIRQGNTGERFKDARKLKLHRQIRMNIPLFLAFNDLIGNLKKYIILIITFILGTAIIIIPNNIISTLNTDETLILFGYVKSDFYIREDMIGNQQHAIKYMEILSDRFEEQGIDAELRADLISNGKLYTIDKSDSISILGFQGIGVDTAEYDYLEGTPPILLNEIAVTEKAAKALGVNIGDKVLCEVQLENKEYIITALFQTFNSLGNGVRFSESYLAEYGSSTSITVSGVFQGPWDEKKLQYAQLKKKLPDLNIRKGKEIVELFIGNMTNQIETLRNLILILVIGINFLITTLILRMLISKEAPEIAILKSLGFHNFDMKRWQLYRIGIILVMSIIIGTLLANTTGNYLASGIFEIMGLTRLHLLIEPLKVYLIYPVIIFIVTMLAVFSSLGQIKRTYVWEINNQE